MQGLHGVWIVACLDRAQLPLLPAELRFERGSLGAVESSRLPEMALEPGSLRRRVVGRPLEGDHRIDDILFPGSAALRPALACMVDQQHRLILPAQPQRPLLYWHPGITFVFLQRRTERRKVSWYDGSGPSDWIVLK